MNTTHNACKVFGCLLSATVLWLVGTDPCGSTPAVAETEAPATTHTNRMTLRDCTRMALAHSPLLKVAAQDQIASSEAVGEARGSYYPTLGVRGGVSRWQSHAFLPSGLSNPNLSSTVGPTDDWSAGGFARYLLYDGGVRRAGLEAGKALESGVAQDGETTRLNVVFDVHQAFYQVAVALELQTVASNSLANAESHLGIAKHRQVAGDTTEADVLRTQVAADNSKAELIRTESLIRIAKGDLNAVMGLPAETSIDIDTVQAALSCSDDMNITNLLEQAIRTRPEIAAAQSAVAAAHQQVQATKGAFGPKVYADGSYGRRDDSAALEDEAWFAGVSVELSVFEGLSTQHKLARTRAEVVKAEAGLERVRLVVRKDVWAAHARVQEAREMVQATTTQVRDAEESLRLMSARYKAGAATVTDLLDVQTALTAAEARHVQARWSCQQAQSALRRATGTLTGEE